MVEMTLDDIKGKMILTTDAKTVGKVVRFELDDVLWKVRSIVCEVEDDAMQPLELKKTLLRPNEILIGKELVRSVKDVVNLNVTMDMLKMQLTTPTSKKQVISDERR